MAFSSDLKRWIIGGSPLLFRFCCWRGEYEVWICVSPVLGLPSLGGMFRFVEPLRMFFFVLSNLWIKKKTFIRCLYVLNLRFATLHFFNFNHSVFLFLRFYYFRDPYFQQGFLSTPPTPNLPGDKHESNRRIIPSWVFRTSKKLWRCVRFKWVMKKKQPGCLGHIGDFLLPGRDGKKAL